MKNFKTLLSVALVFALSLTVANAQTELMTEGFSGTPAGWTIDNTYFGTGNHGLYSGSSSVKMKSDGTTITTATYNSVEGFSFYYLPKSDANVGSEILVEMSNDAGASWMEVHTTIVEIFEADTVWYKDSCLINDVNVTLRVSSSPNASLYLDDFRLTQPEAEADNADLDSIFINDGYIMSVVGQMSYDVDLYYTKEVMIGATSVDPEATITMTQASNIFSDVDAERTAVISIKSKDESVTKDYSVLLNISDTLAFIDFTASSLYDRFYSSTAQFITSTPKDGQNELPAGDASYGFVTNSILTIHAQPNVATISFNAALRKSEGDLFDIKLYQYVGADSTLLEVVSAMELTTTEWYNYSVDVNEIDSVSFKFITTQTSENKTRIFVDDIAVIKDETTGIFSSKALAGVEIYPNPAQDALFVSGVSGDFSVSVFNLNGALVMTSTNTNRIDISTVPAGAYFVKVEANQASSVQKLIVE